MPWSPWPRASMGRKPWRPWVSSELAGDSPRGQLGERPLDTADHGCPRPFWAEWTGQLHQREWPAESRSLGRRLLLQPVLRAEKQGDVQPRRERRRKAARPAEHSAPRPREGWNAGQRGVCPGIPRSCSDSNAGSAHSRSGAQMLSFSSSGRGAVKWGSLFLIFLHHSEAGWPPTLPSGLSCPTPVHMKMTTAYQDLSPSGLTWPRYSVSAHFRGWRLGELFWGVWGGEKEDLWWLERSHRLGASLRSAQFRSGPKLALYRLA